MSDNKKPTFIDNSDNHDSRFVSKDSFWFSEAIDATRWNQSYPYEILVVEATPDGKLYQPVPGWSFVLPIPPQELSISTPFAITTTVTQGGIVEEHNGAPLRNIVFSGTTGAYLARSSSAPFEYDSGKGSHLLKTIFGGTIANATQTAESFKQLSQLGAPSAPKSNLEPEITDSTSDAAKGTGYYQFKLLERFFEQYINAKKYTTNANWRLAFAIYKDKQVYLVTPVEFTLRRSAQSPWEYNYNIAFKAFKRVQLSGTVVNDRILGHNSAKVGPYNQDVLARALGTIQQARQVLANAKNTINAVRSDIDRTVFQPMRETAYFLKDAIGVGTTLVDLPQNILRDGQGAIALFLSTQDNVNEVVMAAKQYVARNNTTDQGKVKVVGQKQGLGSADEFSKMLEDPNKIFEALDGVNIGDVDFAPSITKRIIAEEERVRQLTRLDFEQIRDNLVLLQADFAKATGVSNDTFQEIYGNSSNVEQIKTEPSAEDWEVMGSINNLIGAFNTLSISTKRKGVNLDPMEFVAGFANQNGIAFQVPKSKFPVPFPYGNTLEKLSTQYLGDPNRWHEIATLNGLRAPFVDEEGFELDLLVDGYQNQVSVADVANLKVGQYVHVLATGQQRTKRKILRIKTITATNHVLYLDGDPDLESYSVLASARIHAFLPDTVNSQMMIYIPSDEEVDEDDFISKAIPGVTEFDNVLAMGGVDLLLDSNNDLIITPEGDTRYAVGLANLIQRIRLALSTPKGSLVQHPDFGLGLVPGVSIADLSASDIATLTKNLFANDPTFTGVEGVRVSFDGPVCQISFAVRVAATNQLIPVSFAVNR